MTVEFVEPETQALIEERMVLGHFANVEAVVLDALRTAPSPMPAQLPGQSILDMFAEARAILDGKELDFSSDWNEHPECELDLQ